MAVEDHPKYQEWEAAFIKRNEAKRRYYDALMRQKPSDEISLARLDLEKYQAKYDKIAEGIE